MALDDREETIASIISWFEDDDGDNENEYIFDIVMRLQAGDEVLDSELEAAADLIGV